MTVYTGYSAGQGGVIAQGEAVAYTPEIWIPSVIRNRLREMAMSRYVDMMTFGNGKKGDTIRKPYIGRLKSMKKLPGQPLQFQTRGEGEWKMVLDRYGYSAFSVDRFLDFTTEIDIAREYTPEIARALMEDIEYSLLAERATFISYDSVNNHVISSLPFDFPDFMAAYETLLLRSVDPSEMVFIVGPQTFLTMFSIEEFTQSGVWNSGDLASIKSGTIMGMLMGVPVVLNHNIRTNSLTGITLGGDDYDQPGTTGEQVATPGMATSPFLPTQYGSDRYPIASIGTTLTAGYVSNILMTRKAIALAMAKQPSLEIWWNSDYQETRFASTQIYDIKVVDPRMAVVISTTEG
jgi:hypothetical protein